MKKHYYVLLLSAMACSVPKTEMVELSYPTAEKGTVVDTIFGTAVEDPYRWLEDDMSDETAEWVKAENEVTFSFLDQISFREPLSNRIQELMNYERISAPERAGEYSYYYKNSGLQNHSVVYRKDENGKEEVYLDPNSFAEDGTVGLRGLEFCEDGSVSAHLITEGGSDWRKIIVLDAETKEVLEDTLVDVKFSGVSWFGNEGFYYSSYDKPKEGSALSAKTQKHKVYYHKLGTAQSDDPVVFGGDMQPSRYAYAGVSDDQQYIVYYSAQTTSGNKVYLQKVGDSEIKLIQGDDNSEFSYVANVGDKFYFHTNIDAPNYRLVSFNLDTPGQENWEEVIPESENVLSVSIGGGKLFAQYLADAVSKVVVYDFEGNLENEVALPGKGNASGFSGEEEDSVLYYSYSSFVTPTTIYTYDVASQVSKIYAAPKTPFDPSLFDTEQVFYTSKDGTKVPMFVIYKKGLEKNGKNPTILYGYGGFNISLKPRFSSSLVAWLENGGVYAQANLRGGGEYGEEWHVAGTKMQKQNVFDDFIAAGEYLINEKYTSSDYLALQGGSNGGLLVAATMTQRPDLAKVVFPQVGVLDMLRYHKFTAGAGWAYDYGTADDSEEMFEYLLNYSPYHALKEGVSYPATMVTTADHDDRVVPAHSFKFAARLQEYHKGANPVLIRIQTNAGHGSVSTEQRVKLTTDLYAFAWYNMGYVPTQLNE